MVRLKITIGILSILLIALVVMFVGTFPRSSMRAMQRFIPQAVEIFEQSRESLETLRSGEFAANNAVAFYHPSGLIISCDYMGGVFYPDWYTIEWLSSEERDAIVFLLSSDELARNFVRVESSQAALNRVSGPVGDAMVILYPGVRPRSSWEFPFMEDTYVIDLEDGYRLWLYTWQGPSMGAAFAMVFTTIIRLILLVLMVIVSWQLVKAYKKIKAAKTESDTSHPPA